MSTFLWALAPNGRLEDVVAGSGQTNSGGIINLQIDMTTSGPYLEGNTQRAITKAEVIEGIEVIKQYIIRGNWGPP